MSVGPSGRVVVEVDSDLKRDLYAALNRRGLTLKDWFIENAAIYLANESQLSLDLPQPARSRPHERSARG